MKKSLLTALSLLLCVALLAMPMVVSASTAVEKVFDPITTMWYTVDFVRTNAANASSDAYVYTWTPDADGELTLAADTDCKDAMVSVVNTSDKTDTGVTYKYYPKGGFSNKDGVTYDVNGGDKYEISVMTCTETSGTVSFFAYYTATTAAGLQGAGTYNDPYIVDDTVKSLPTIKAGETIYFLLTCDKTLTYDLKVNGANAKDSFDLYIENNKATASSQGGTATVKTITPFAASGYIMFSITNTGNTQGGSYTYVVTKAVNAGTKGTMDDPANLVLDTLTTANITSVCYYYTYTATEDGTLSVKVETKDNWVCSINGGSAESAYCSASDEPLVNPVEYPVVAGDEISIWVATEDFGAGSVSFIASLKTVEETTATEPEVVTTVATEPNENVTTASTEPEEITTVSTEPGETTTSATEPNENVTTASTEPEEITTVSTEPEDITTSSTEPEGITTVPVLTTAPLVDEDGAFTDINEDYCLSATPLQLGDNEIILSKVYPNTLFEFTPPEYAQYKITASDANALVGAYVGTVNYIPVTAVGTSNEVTVDFTSGMDIIIAVSGSTNCTLTIEKTGDVVIKEEAPWTVYENKVEVTDIETDVNIKDLTNVMIYDDVANSAVLGSDGYYHLDSADGEILYVNLNSNVMSFVDNVANTKLSAVFYDENGNVTEKIDFTAAVLEYIENAAQIENGEEIFYFYPLTADLIEMYQVVGLANDWYGRTGWVGGIEDDAWMFACFYEEGVTTGGNAPEVSVQPGNPSTVPTGRDFTVVYASVTVMLISAVLVAFIVARKKVTE